MALTENLDLSEPRVKELKQKSASITDGALTALISGVAGKRIKIWRLNAFIGTQNKTCEFLSGANSFTSICSVKTMHQVLKGSDGIPAFTCNAGEDFKADPSDSTNWYFYLVYTID